MKHLQKTLLLFTVLALAIASPISVFAQATDAPNLAELQRFGISCSDDTCTVEINLPSQLEEYRPLLHSASFALNVLQQNIQLLPEGAGFQVRDALNLTFPLGGLSLVDADVTVEVDREGVLQRMVGSASAPALRFVGVDAQHGADVSFGFDQGSGLEMLDAPVDPEQNYLYLQVGAPTPGDVLLQKGPRKAFAVMVTDTEGSFFYLDSAATMRSSTMALMEALLPLNAVAESLVDWALSPQQMGARVSALWTGDPDESYLKVHTAYAIDGGLLTRWLPFDFTPLALNSVALIDGGGLHLTASTASSVAPSVVGEGELQASLFIPFVEGFEPSLALATSIAAPYLGLHTAGEIELGDEIARVAEAVAAVSRIARDEFLAPAYSYATAGASWGSEAAVGSYTAAAKAAHQAAATTADSTRSAFFWVADASGQTATLVVDAAGRAFASIVDGSGRASSWVADVSGQTASTVVDASGQAVASTVDATTSAAGWVADASGAVASAVVDASGQAVASTVDAASGVYSTTVSAPGHIVSSVAASDLVQCGLITSAQSWCAAMGWCAPQSDACSDQQVAGLTTED